MSIVNINVDTTEKTVVVELDGAEVENVHEIMIYTPESMMGFAIDIGGKEYQGDMKKYTRLCSSKNSIGTEIIKVEEDKVKSDIEKFFGTENG